MRQGRVYKPFFDRKFHVHAVEADDRMTYVHAVLLGVDWEVGPYVLMKYERGNAQPLFTEFVPDRSEFFAVCAAFGWVVPDLMALEQWQRTPVLVRHACNAFLMKE